MYALDLSVNRIRATWQELLPIVKSFLDGEVVLYLDLSTNYLPGLEALQENTTLLNTYKSFGERLCLRLDGNPLTGNEETDHWIKLAEGSSKRLMDIDMMYTAQSNDVGFRARAHA